MYIEQERIPALGLGFGLVWGYQLIVLFSNAFVMALDTIRAASDFSYYVALGIIAVSVGMYALLRERENHKPDPKNPVYVQLMILAGAFMALAVVLVAISAWAPSFIASVAGLFAGTGLGLAYLLWLHLFSYYPSEVARKLLLYSLVIGLVLFALLANASTAVCLISLGLVSVAVSVLGRAFAQLPLPDAEEAPVSAGAVLFENKFVCGAVLILGFVYGICAYVSLTAATAPTDPGQALLSHLIIFALSVLLFTGLSTFLPRKTNIASLFQVVLPLVLTALVLLPFLGDRYSVVFGSAVGLAYQLGEILLFYSFATMASHHLYYKTACLPFIAMWTGTSVGLLLGQTLFTFFSDRFFVLATICIFTCYVMFIVVLLITGMRRREVDATEAIYRLYLESESEGETPTLDQVSEILVQGLPALSKQDREMVLGDIRAKSAQLREAKEQSISADTDSLEDKCKALAATAELTSREAQVLAYLAHGRSGSYIAERMYLAPSTVKGYTKAVYTKLGVHSKQELIDMVEAAE